jgi:5-methylcytosine-specific restriction endonuclease McrA
MRHCTICKTALRPNYKCSRCYECNRLYMQRYKAVNSERMRLGQRDHYRRNSSRRKLAAKFYRERDPVRTKVRKADDYQKHRDARRAKIDEWQQNNATRYAEIMRVRCLNRIARKRGAEGHYTQDDIARLMKKQLGKCAWCHIDVINNYHVDHIKALKRGGSNWPQNLQLLCPPCNSRKSMLSMQEFAIREYRYNPMYREAA